MTNTQVLETFRRCGALLDGHFILRSGLHSRQFFQCALLLQHARLSSELLAVLCKKLDPSQFETVVSPALGGILVGQEMARLLDKRHIFAEKEDGKLVMRRGFEVRKGEKFLVAEDVVTQGGRVKETLEIIRARGGIIVAVAVIVDRSTTPIDFGAPFHSLVKLEVETFPADQIPADLKAIQAIKPGSK